MTTTYTLAGVAVAKATTVDVANLRVEAWDADGVFEEMLGLARTDQDGRFEIHLTDDDLAGSFGDRPPRLYFRVIQYDRDILADTKESLVWQADARSPFLRVPVGAPIGTIETLAKLHVVGTVYNVDSGPLYRMTVEAVDALATADGPVLGSDNTDTRGRFRIAYDEGAYTQGKKLADIRLNVSFLGTPLFSSDVRFQAAPWAVIDLVQDGEAYLGAPEADRVLEAVTPALGSAQLEDLDDAQIEQLAGSARQTVADVRALSRAHRIASESVGLDAPVLFGLIRDGLPDERRTLIPRPASQHRRSIERAVEDRTISTMDSAQIDAAVAAIVEEGVRLVVDEPLATGITCNLGYVLKIALDETTTDDKTREFVRRFYNHSGALETFWANLTTTTFTSTDRDRLQLALQWGTLTRWHKPLIDELEAQRVAETATSLRDLAKYDEATWRGILAGLDPAHQFPADIPGVDETEKLDNYAKVLERTLEYYLPTPALAGRLLDLDANDPVGRFLDDAGNSAFALGKVRVLQYLADSPTYPSGVTEEEVRDDLLKFERLVKVTPRHAEMTVLLNAGIDSAHAIARMGEAQFVRRFGGSLDTVNGDEIAYRMHKRGVQQKDLAMGVLSMFSGDINGLGTISLPDKKESLPEADSPLLAGWEELFGQVGDCVCRHCRSVLSPAAYFVDLLQFLHRFDSEETYGSTGVWTARDVLIGAQDGGSSMDGRRPDLRHLALSCANADTAVVYVDLVNEILERHVAGATLPSEPIETKATKEELLAAPEILDLQAHDTAYDILSSAHYPWILPFSQWALQTRIYLNHLGAPRHELMETLQSALRLRQIRGCIAWLRADAVDVGAEGKIERWRDLSGHGHDASQTAFGAQATAELASSPPYASFAGAQFYSIADVDELDLSEVTIVVVTSDQGSGDQWLVGKGLDAAQNYGLLRTSANNVAVAHASGTINGPTWNTTLTVPVVTIVAVRNVSPSENAVEWRIDGAVTTSSPATLALDSNASPLMLGAKNTGSGPADGFSGRLYELAIFNRRLTSEEAEQIEAYAFARYQAAPAADFPPKERIAQETLGMSTNERLVIIGAAPGSPDPWELWGYDTSSPEGTDWDQHLLTASNFVAASRGTYDELRELVDTSFLRHFNGTSLPNSPALVPAAGTDGCQLNEILIGGLVTPLPATWNAVQRFVRLARRLGLSVTELDKLLAVFSFQLDDSLLVNLAGALELRKQFPRVPVDELASWWGDIDTRPTPSHDIKSLYERLFLNKAVEQPVVDAFLSLTGTLSAYRPHILASIRMSARDYALLTDPIVSDAHLDLPPVGPTDDALTLTNLSRLFRLVSFSRVNRLTVSDVTILQALSGLAPLEGDASAEKASPGQTRVFLAHLDRWRTRDIRMADLQWWLRGVEEPREGLSVSMKTTLAHVEAIEAAVEDVNNATAPDGTADPQRLSELLIEALGANDPTLSEEAAATKAAAIVAVVDGSSELDLLGQRDVLELALGPLVDDADLATIHTELLFRPFTDVGSCQVWLEPPGLAVTATEVHEWTNLATSSTVTQGTSANRPRYVEHGPFGLAAASFDGDTSDPDFLVINSSYTNSTHSFFFILRQLEHTEDSVALLDVDTGQLVVGTRVEGLNDLGYYDGTTWTTQSAAELGPQILSWTFGGGVANVYRGGTLVHSAATSIVVGFDGTVRLGGTATLGLASFKGEVAVVGVFNEALEAEPLRRVHDYLALLAGQTPSERFRVVEEALLAKKRLSAAAVAVKARASALLGIPQDVAAHLLTEALTSSTEPLTGPNPLLHDFLPDTDATPDDRVRSMTKLRKAAGLVDRLDLDLEMLQWLGDQADTGAWLDLDALPSEGQPTFDTSSGRTDGGKIALPGWLQITCSSNSRSTKVGDALVAVGLGADVPRAYALDDGKTFGLLVEPGATNLIADQAISGWTLSAGELATHPYMAPDGSDSATEIIDDNTASIEARSRDLGVALSPDHYTLSAWTANLGADTALLPRVSGNTGDPILEVSGQALNWEHRAVTSEVTASGAGTTVEVVARSETASKVGAARVWGMQLEARRYPTSFVGSDATTFSRTADMLKVANPDEVIRPDGRYSVTLRYAPLYAASEANAEHDLVRFDDEHRVYFDPADRRIVFKSGGATLKSSVLTFERLAQLTVIAENVPSGVRLLISGATQGDGEWASSWTTKTWAASAPSKEGTLTLPTWLIYECATSDTTAQTSESTVRGGFAASAPRAFSRDGVAWGLLVEPETTNLIDAGNDLEMWTAVGTPTITPTIGADGSVGNYQIADDDGGSTEGVSDAAGAIVVGTYTASLWRDKLDSPGVVTSVQQVAGGAFFSPSANIDTASVSGGWEYAVKTSLFNTTTGTLETRVLPAASATGSARLWGLQLETRDFATSFTSGSRATSYLKGLSSVVATHGYFELALTAAPLYASSSASVTRDYWLWVDNDNNVYFDASDDSFHFVAHGAEVATVGPVSFAAHAVLTITAKHKADGVSLEVAGASSGNGTDTAAAVAPLSLPLPEYIHFLSNNNGCQGGAALHSMVSRGVASIEGNPANVYILGNSTGAQEGAVLTYLSFSTQALSSAKDLYARLVNLVDFVALRNVVKPSADSLVNLLRRTVGADALPPGQFLDSLSASTGWNREDLGILVEALHLTYPDDWWTGYALARLRDAFALINRLATPARDALRWLNVDESAAPGRETASEALRAAKNKHDDEMWPTVGRPLRDVLREAQRLALTDHVVHQSPDVESPDELYEKLLVDVEMSPCQLTSRLVQANSSIQLFVQRILLNVENDPDAATQIKPDGQMAREWKWMKNYRVWEANRKVFLYPENWIEPELRDDKSPLFEKLEAELLQTEISDASAESAYRKYLEGLAEISRLDIFAMTRGVAYFGQPPKGIPLHIFGRTLTEQGQKHYHRTLLPAGNWEPWRPIELDIKSDHAIPFLRHEKIHLAWLNIEERPGDTPSPQEGDTPSEPEVAFNLQLAFSHVAEGGWAPPSVTPSFSMPATLKNNGYDYARERQGIHLVFEHGFRPSVFVEYFHRGWNWEALWPFDGFYIGEVGHRVTVEPHKAYTGFRDLPGRPYFMDIGARDPGSQFDFKVQVGKGLQKVDLLGQRPSVWRALTDHYRTQSHAAPATEFFYKDEARTFYAVAGDYYPNQTLSLGTWTEDLAVQPVNAMNTADVFHGLGEEVAAWAVSAGGEAVNLHAMPTEERVRFWSHHHPLVNNALAALGARGVDGLLEWNGGVLQLESSDFFAAYSPHPDYVHSDVPKDEFDFEFDGAYAGYNWEVFFHIPLMIALRLSKEQRHEEARRWFHAIFDPTDGSAQEGIQRFWKVKPFYFSKPIKTIQEEMLSLQVPLAETAQLKALLGGGGSLTKLTKLIEAWRNDPFNPHLVARMRPVAYQKATVMRYLDNLIEWGDHLFRQFTMESVAEATQLYLLAKGLLGPRPVFVQRPVAPSVLTYDAIESSLDAFSNSIENLIPPDVEFSENGEGVPPTPSFALTFCIPPNDKLLGYWDLVEDRLYKIRHCMDVEGVIRELPLFEPPIDPALLVQAAAAGLDLSSVLSDLKAPPPVYRFQLLLQRAMDFAQGVVGLGASLLGALEKKDGEEMVLLRQRQEIAMLDLVRETRKRQIEEAEENVAALQAQREATQRRFEFYRDIEFLNANESGALDLALAGSVLQTVAQALQGGAAGVYAIPNFILGVSGTFGSPVSTADFGGEQLGKALESTGDALTMVAGILRDQATRQTTLGEYERRWDDWKLQEDLAERELKQIDKQIAASTIRVEIAKRELQAHERQLQDSKDVEDFLKRKYTNQQLYAWMDGQLRQTYFKTYQLAYSLARQAERAYQFERGDLKAKFVEFGYWDGRRAGLLAGERLVADLRTMESAFLTKNRREHEIVKHISLAQHFPEQLVALRELGTTVVSFGEALFDRDYPGHYMRRVKSVSMTVAAVSGPYEGVQCRLTLLKSRMRKDSVSGASGYPYVDAEDARFIHDFGVRGSVCTSGAQNDAGLFQLNFQDERYLPFEGAGAVSEWRIEMDPETNRFDLHSVTDVILHVSYMARDGGEALRAAAKSAALGANPRTAKRLFSLRHEFPTAWTKFENELEGIGEPVVTHDQVLTVDLIGKLPYLYGRNAIRATTARLSAKWAGKTADIPVKLTPSGGTSTAVTVPPVPVLAGLDNLQSPAGDPAEGLWEIRIEDVDIGELDTELTETWGTGGARRIKPDQLQDLFLILDLERDPAAS